MVKKTDRRKRDIKTKLMAAICMLMVSCIMVISSTYAWFTLSTAPEVKGINTAVGANGNLEMALLPEGTSVSEALAMIGASGANVNNTWGNLVDLSDNTIYGLRDIVLNPSTLGTVTDSVLPSHFLSAPTYGADGRVSGMNSTMLIKNYQNGAFNQDTFGVRALGTSSGMSAREMAYRNALVAADTAFDAALAAVKNSVSEGGSSLADLAIKKANDKTNGAIYNDTDVAAMVSAYGLVNTAIDKIENALKLYVIADYMATAPVTDENFAATLTTMQGMTLAQLTATDSAYDDGITNAATMAENLSTLRATVQTQVDGLSALSGGSYTWAQLGSYVNPLAEIDNMKLNGNAIGDYLNGNTDLTTLVNGEKRLVVNANGTDTTGIFVAMANYVDSFSTPVVFEQLSYGGLTVNNVSVTMIVNATVQPAHLKVADDAATDYADGVFSSTANNIDSFYGFIVDMVFRTNAVDSSLLLQTDAIDRIYSDNTANPATMGGGSTMTYTATQASGYNVEQLKGLMGNIRIVLFNPDTLAIYGYARLDVSAATVSDDGSGEISVTMPIKMYDEGAGSFAANANITRLVQNEATAVSSLVYLDGVNLTNADVGNASIQGTMNIQFASSAELKPMEYGDLRKDNGQTPTSTTYDVKVNGVKVADATKDASYTLDLSTGQFAGYTVTKVMMNGVDITATAVRGTTVAITGVDGAIEITATAPVGG